MMAATISSDDLKALLASRDYVLVDVKSTRCPPCRALEPVLRQLAEHYGDRLCTVSLDVHQEREFALVMSVASVPTLLVYERGAVIGRRTGFASYAVLTGWIDGLIPSGDTTP